MDLQSFLEINKNKTIIAVQGLGFVGSVMSLVCANSKKINYAVIGVEAETKKGDEIVSKLNSGKLTINSTDLKVNEYYTNAIKNRNFFATTNIESFRYADVIIVDTNLDIKKDYSPFSYEVLLDPFLYGISSIAKNCKENSLVIVESTVPPGCCLNYILPIFKKEFHLRNLNIDNFKLSHSYERVMPGLNYIDSIENYYRVYSGINKLSENAAAIFLSTIINVKKYPLTKLKNTNSSEISKLLENSYRAMNIAFMVEWSRFAEVSGANLYEIVYGIRKRNSHSNMMLPGLGVGGYCLTKDPLIANWSYKNVFNGPNKLELSENAVLINEKMPIHAFNFFYNHIKIPLKNKNILLLGVSYTGDVADTRFSPVYDFHSILLKFEAKIYLHDPLVSYWEEKNALVSNDLDISINNSIDIYIITTSHSIYKNGILYEKLLKIIKKIIIYDVIGVFTDEQYEKLNKLHKILVIGRGDY